jgi:hypothetical protein
MTMKKVALLLAILMLFAVCFTACGGEEDDTPEGMKRISDPTIVGYSLYVPEVWIADLNTGAVSAYHSQTDASSVVMNQWNLKDGITTVEGWWEQYADVFAETFRDFALESEEECFLGGLKARKYVYTAKMATGEKDPASEDADKQAGLETFRFMQVATIYRGMVYVFTYTSTTAIYESNLAEVQQILDNFKFNK